MPGEACREAAGNRKPVERALPLPDTALRLGNKGRSPAINGVGVAWLRISADLMTYLCNRDAASANHRGCVVCPKGRFGHIVGAMWPATGSSRPAVVIRSN